MRSIHALALALILAPLVGAEPPPSAAAATTAAAVPTAAAAAHMPPLAERTNNSGDLTSEVRRVPSAEWASIGPTKPATTGVGEGNNLTPGQEPPPMATLSSRKCSQESRPWSR